MRTTALSLLSGGLDSTLSTKLIIDQGIEVTALHFVAPFASRKERERGLQAERTAAELGVELLVRSKGEAFLDVIRNPGHGYGRNMNPCIDCRIYMLRETKQVMEDRGAGFVITGEVLGQRPMSQMRDTILLIERESGLDGLIVRPLSAIHFAPSFPEQEGSVDRKRLLDISGRSRKVQNQLASQYGLKEFGYPAGGCLLTDPVFSAKMRDLLKYDPRFTMRDVEWLNVGRHFRLSPGTKVIVGRNQSENELLGTMREAPWVLITPLGFKGPSALALGPVDSDAIDLIALILARYGKEGSPTITVEVNDGSITRHVAVQRDVGIDALMITEER